MRAPTDAEIAGKIGISEDELEKSLSDISRSSMAALDELWTPQGGGDQVALIDTIEDTGRGRSGVLARADRAERGARRGDRAAAGAREARRHALLLRGADAARDRRGARRDRVPGLAAPHQGRAAAEGAARRAASAGRGRARTPSASAATSTASVQWAEPCTSSATSIVRSPSRRRRRGRASRRRRPATRLRCPPTAGRRPGRRQSPSGEVSIVVSTRRAPAGTVNGCGVRVLGALDARDRPPSAARARPTIVTVEPIGARAPGAGVTPSTVPGVDVGLGRSFTTGR